MRVYSIGICDRDTEYASRLSDYINRENGDEFRSYVFSDMSSVIEGIDRFNLDLVLGNRSDSSCAKSAVRFVVLAESPQDIEEEGIFKYQRSGVLVGEIRRILHPVVEKEYRSCIAVYSPLGRCGRTRLAKGLTTWFGNDGLYIGMEDFSESIEACSTDILYLAKQKSPGLAEALEKGIIQRNGIWSLYASGAYFDTRDVLAQDFEYLCEVLLGSGRYSVLIFDIGAASLDSIETLDFFDIIYMPVLHDEVSRAKLNTFRRLLTDSGYGDIKKKICETDVSDVPFNSEAMKTFVDNLRQR